MERTTKRTRVAAFLMFFMLQVFMGYYWLPTAQAGENREPDVYKFATDPNNIVWNPSTHTAEYMEFDFTLPAGIGFTKGKYAVIRHSTDGGNWEIVSSAIALANSAAGQYHVSWNNIVFKRGPQQLAIFDGDPCRDPQSQLKAMGWFPYIINDLTPALVANNDNQTGANDLVITFSLDQNFAASSFPTGMYAVLRYAPNKDSQYIPARERNKVENLGANRYRVTWNNAAPNPGRFEVVVFDGKDSNPQEKKICAIKAAGFYEYPFQGNSEDGPSQNDPPQENPSQDVMLKAAAGNGYINLSWNATAHTAGLDGYYLYRGITPSGEDASPLFDFPLNTLTYKDTQVVNGTTYYYILKPCYNKGTLLGSASNEVSAAPGVQTSGTVVLTIGNPYMQVNGQDREIDPGKGTAPTIVGARTFLPIRAVIEAMGGSVDWDGNAGKVTIVLKKQTINLWIGKTTATVNGTTRNLDVAPYISSTGRTMIPLRFVTENLGCKVIWNGPEQMVTINIGNQES